MRTFKEILEAPVPQHVIEAVIRWQTNVLGGEQGAEEYSLQVEQWALFHAGIDEDVDITQVVDLTEEQIEHRDYAWACIEVAVYTTLYIRSMEALGEMNAKVAAKDLAKKGREAFDKFKNEASGEQ